MGGELFEQKATAIPVRKGGEVHSITKAEVLHERYRQE